MFAYCLNNPVTHVDPTGAIADFAGNPTRNIEQMMLIGCGAGTAVVIFVGAAQLGIAEIIQKGLTEIVETVEETKKSKCQYWEAWRDKNGVHIGRGLTFGEATLRVALGLDIMCANQDAARWLIVINGYWGAVGPEKHGGDGFFWHYHPHRHTHTHIWFL